MQVVIGLVILWALFSRSGPVAIWQNRESERQVNDRIAAAVRVTEVEALKKIEEAYQRGIEDGYTRCETERLQRKQRKAEKEALTTV